VPRVTRGLADGMIYHVINRGNCRQEVFHKDSDFQAFVSLLREAREKHPVKLMAYCLMSNHFHLLLSPEKADDLSKFMQWLMTSHVRRYHRHYRTSGHVWQGRYKSFIVEEDGHLLTVARYVEGNPVRINLVPSADEWPWSSHGERLNGGNLIDGLPLELPANWTEYVNQPTTESELERVQQSVNRGAPFGGQPWQMSICEKLGLESTVRAKGRPRKWGQEK
jgi:REP-associated tyrosine transposase